MSPRVSVLTAAAFLGALLTPPVAVGQQAPAPNGRFIIADGVRIYFEESGRGTPLFLLHGFKATGDILWGDFVPALAARYHVIRVDLPGHGRSDPMDTTIVFRHERAARIMLALLDSLHADSMAVLGYSAGGITALYMASMRPQSFSAIAVVGAQMYYSRQVRDFITSNGPDSANSGVMASLTARHGATKGMQLARQFWHFRELIGDPAITPDQLGRISARTLIIHGDNDFVPVAQAWEMFKDIPNARLWVVPNGGHVPIFLPQNRDDAMRRILEFLNDQWRPR